MYSTTVLQVIVVNSFSCLNGGRFLLKTQNLTNIKRLKHVDRSKIFFVWKVLNTFFFPEKVNFFSPDFLKAYICLQINFVTLQ